MANEIATSTEKMNEDIISLSEMLGKTRQTMERVIEQIKELDSMWEGVANTEFNIAFSHDVEFADSVFDTVENIIECMTYAKNEYVKCEGEVSGIVDSIRI